MRVPEGWGRLFQALAVMLTWGLDITKVKMDGVTKEKLSTSKMAHWIKALALKPEFDS